MTPDIDTARPLLARLDIPFQPNADGCVTVPAWVIDLTADAAAAIRALTGETDHG